HLVPAVLLALFLLSVLVYDIVFGPVVQVLDEAIPIDPNPRIAVNFDTVGKFGKNKDQIPLMNFGITTLPRNINDVASQLTFDTHGATNSTVLHIGGADFTFGKPADGKWITMAEKFGDHGGKKSVWLPQKGVSNIQVTQLVDIIPGDPVELKSGKLKRYLDTCRIRWVLKNTGKTPTDVGLRFALDTLIGGNDGVPFTVPGKKGLVDKMAEFPTPKQIPDFVQVLEFPDLANPGIVGFINLKLGGATEAPNRMLLTEWPFQTNNLFSWDVPVRPFNGDSAVVLYWHVEKLKPGQEREVGFAYGLGNLSIAGGKLGVSVGGNFVVNGEMTIQALVNNPEKGQKLTLKLPDGLSLIDRGTEHKIVEMPQAGAVQQSPVDWRIRADRQGTFVIEVLSSTGISQKKTITIKAKTIF
ncbi:MAG TPA: hypothetical protein VE988_16650, partial [Gemmataceae bacterium]|nr:hypothetical protein [Gemmataceae bacterium]